ncbi:hypothetical protein [Vibrio olivae]|uniref:Serine/threonine protein kinase n=1 Tax=Vibrio olivae TaxID=1243002 RepID=A0ABV5HQP4_9VIBR
MRLITRNPYVYQLEVHGRQVWLKKCGEDKRNWFNVLTNKLFRSCPHLTHLALYSAYPPKQRFLHELEALEYALAHHLPVPKLIFKTRSSFATENSGIPIHQVQNQPQERLYINAFKNLQRLHQEGFIHGRPAMRDIVVDEQGKVTFLDLEESRVSTLPKLQVRDLILFMLDSYRLESVSQETRLQELLAWHLTASEAMRTELHKTIEFIHHWVWLPTLILRFRHNRLSQQYVALHGLLRRYEQETSTQTVVKF